MISNPEIKLQPGWLRSIRALGGWWVEELQLLIPGWSEQTQSTQESTIVFEYESASESVVVLMTRDESEVAVLPITLSDVRNGGLDKALSSFRDSSTRVYIRFSNDDVMTTRVSLPRATEQDLQSVLGFEMDRHTPFTADQVYFDFDVVDRSDETLALNLMVIPRSTVNSFLSTLEKAGIDVDGVIVSDDHTVRAGLLPNNYFLVAGRERSRTGQFTWRPVLALLLLIFVSPVIVLKSYNSILQKDHENLSAQAADLLAGKKKFEDLLVPSRYFYGLRKATPRAIEVLNELSRIIPDNTWVSNFNIEESGITIVGESTDAAALIGLLEGSDYLSDSRFTSSVTRNASTGNDRYTITAEISAGWNDE